MMDWTERLAAYLGARLPSAERVTVVNPRAMPAGASNETVGFELRVAVEGREWTLPMVLRPQREEGILAPYDVSRQFRVMRALAGTGVPVPAVAWLELGAEVLGTPFFVMARVRGETLPLFWYGRSERLPAAAGALAAVHAVDWRGAGLAFLSEGSLSDPLEAELGPWRARAERLRIARAPLLVALGEWLRANQPADARMALLHGDPNPGNYLFEGDRVVAVLDWELAALGDPRSDLGFYAALQSVFGGMSGPRGDTLLSEAYAAVTGRSADALEYYEALGLYRMAIVMAGWAGRFGAMSAGRTLEVISRRLAVLLGPRWAG
jgi:aminoglycoside phosphotransferase (APT) family kinase protein